MAQVESGGAGGKQVKIVPSSSTPVNSNIGTTPNATANTSDIRQNLNAQVEGLKQAVANGNLDAGGRRTSNGGMGYVKPEDKAITGTQVKTTTSPGKTIEDIKAYADYLRSDEARAAAGAAEQKEAQIRDENAYKEAAAIADTSAHAQAERDAAAKAERDAERAETIDTNISDTSAHAQQQKDRAEQTAREAMRIIKDTLIPPDAASKLLTQDLLDAINEVINGGEAEPETKPDTEPTREEPTNGAGGNTPPAEETPADINPRSGHLQPGGVNADIVAKLTDALKDAGIGEETPTDTEEEPTRPREHLKPGGVSQDIIDQLKAVELDIQSGLDYVDISGLRDILSQIEEAQKEQSGKQMDYAVEQGVNELTRALEDAQRKYQTERDQISIDEQRALDNQALYAQARGDRGGIAAEQYNSIQNTAATNRYRVNQEQTQLATDTARQVADLRAKGEFDKADAVMQITQNYLSNPMELEKYALSTNMSVDQFNAQLEQWKAEQALATQQYLLNSELSRASLSGVFSDGTSTLAAKQAMQEQLASAASAMISLGIEPTKEQLDALGWTPEQYTAYKVAMEAGQLQNIDPRSLPVYWTNSATGQLEQIDNATYWKLLNGNDMGNYKADGSTSGTGTSSGTTSDYEQAAADKMSELLQTGTNR